MELVTLRYFQKVAELEHMTRAASELHVSQPAVSQAINSLEKMMGRQFFDRNGKSIRLNAYGRIFKRYTDVILQNMEDAERELEEYDNQAALDVSLSLRIAVRSLPDILIAFKRQYPEARLDIAQHQYLLDDWHDSPCDLTLFSSALPVYEDNAISLLEENILMAVPHDHPFAGEKEITLNQAAGEPFILSSPANSNLRHVIGLYCDMAQFQPNVAMEIGGDGAVLQCVKAGMGIAFFPEYSWPRDDDKLRYVKIVNPSFKRYVTISWKKDRFISKGSTLFKNFVIDYFKYGEGAKQSGIFG